MSKTGRKKLEIGIFGTGHLGKIHLKCLESTPFAVRGFYDADEKIASEVENEFGIRRYLDADDLIRAVDAVDVVTSTSAHYDIARKAILAGKHVFIEKPVTHRIREAEALLQLVKEKKVIVQVGHVERYNPAFRSLSDVTLEPKFIEAHRLSEFKPRGTDVSVVLDLMIHDLDLILSLVRDEIVEIRANGVSVIGNKPDICNARITFQRGCVANVTASRISMKNMRKIRFFQKNTYISVDFLQKESQIIQLVPDKGPVMPGFVLDTAEGKKTVKMIEPEVKDSNAIVEELKDFHNSIITGTPPPVSLEDGYRALKLAAEIEAVAAKNNY